MIIATSTCLQLDASTTQCVYDSSASSTVLTTAGFTNGEIINSVFLEMIFFVLTIGLFLKILKNR